MVQSLASWMSFRLPVLSCRQVTAAALCTTASLPVQQLKVDGKDVVRGAASGNVPPAAADDGCKSSVPGLEVVFQQGLYVQMEKRL